MATLITIYWRDIPSQVMTKIGRKVHKSVLADRFQEAIDTAAMRAGLHGTEAYLEQWRRVTEDCGEQLADELTARVAKLEEQYCDYSLTELIRNQGWQADTASQT